MVSISNIVTGAVILGGISAFAGLGGFKGIGSKIGAGFGDFGTSLISSFTSSMPKQGTLQSIVTDLDLEPQVKGIPEKEATATPQQKGLLQLAGVLQQENYGGTINLETATFENQYTTQPLDFAISKSGKVKTGTVGLGASTLAAQQALSQKFGIPTFDVKGNISTFAGLKSGGGSTGGSSGGSTGGSTGGSSGSYSSGGSIKSGSYSGHGMGGFRV